MEAALFDDVLRDVRAALESEDISAAKQLLDSLHPADVAEAIGDLSLDEQTDVLPELDVDDAADVLEFLDEDEAAEIAANLPVATLATLLDEMEPDEAADVLLDLSSDQADAALAHMASADRVQPLLAHDDDTAGGRMTSQVPILRRWMTTTQAIAYLRTFQPERETHYYLYVVDRNRKLIGIVGLRELILAAPDERVETIMSDDVISVSVDADQETCTRLISRYELLALPVVDAAGQLVGVITHDDLVEVIEDEATEDIYALASVSADSDLDVFSPITMMISRRLPWLYLNLGTAFLAAFVISRFEATIAQVAALAVFQSVVAGLGGNAGTQALAIAVRGLALGELEFRHARRAILRECLIGLTNGLAVGLAVGVVAYLWKGNPFLGVIMGLATLGNLFAAGIAGTLVPLTLKALRQDPALASSVLVTATTDSLGFGLFLGLATIFLPHLT
ncbi:MAG: magnesium transporter [Anaerolineales bacterium]